MTYTRSYGQRIFRVTEPDGAVMWELETCYEPVQGAEALGCEPVKRRYFTLVMAATQAYINTLDAKRNGLVIRKVC